MAKKSIFLILVAILFSTALASAVDYLIPGDFNEAGIWWGVSLERNNNVPYCIGEIDVGSSVTMVSTSGEEFQGVVELGPVFFSPTYMNTYRIGVGGFNASGELKLKISCPLLNVSCIDQEFYREDLKDEESKLPGFAFGIYDGEIVRMNDVCENGVLTRYRCDGLNAVPEVVECECAGNHCIPQYTCVDTDAGKNYTFVRGNATVIREDMFFEEKIIVDSGVDICVNRALTEVYCEANTSKEVSSVVMYCPTECADNFTCAVPEPEIPPIENQSGCCLNKYSEPCRFYERALDCCPDLNYSGAPSSQSDCFANYFYPSSDQEACALMDGTRAPNWRVCENGCCCSYDTNAREAGFELWVKDAMQTARAECMPSQLSKAFYSFEEIGNCTTTACAVKLGGTSGNRPPIFSGMNTTYSMCSGEKLGFDVVALDPDSQLLTYEATGLPEGALFQQKSLPQYIRDGYTNEGYRFIWENPQIGSYSIVFTANDGVVSVNQSVNLSVTECGEPKGCPEFPSPENTSVCKGTAIEFCVEGFGAVSIPEGANFEDSCFSWTSEEAGNQTATFSSPDCEDTFDVLLTARECEEPAMNKIAKGILWGVIIALVLAIIAILLANPATVWFGIALATQPWLFLGIFAAIGAVVGGVIWYFF